MSRKIIRMIAFAWTALSFIIDLYAAIIGNVGPLLLVLMIGVELLICWIAYQMLIGKRWALISLVIYYGLRSFNVYTESFSFYSKSGLNIEVSIGQVLGVNAFTLIIFVLLIIEQRKSK
jgi:hypothetical protein